MEYKIFEVAVDDAVDTETAGEGYIDSRQPQSFGTLPTTLANSTLKEKANMRWDEIVKFLALTGAQEVYDVVETGGTHNTAPTVITFKVKYGADQIVFLHDIVADATGKTIYGPDSLNLVVSSDAGLTYTSATELEVIEKAVAMALAQPSYTKQRQIYDPTAVGGQILWADKFVNITTLQFGNGATWADRVTSVLGTNGITVTAA